MEEDKKLVLQTLEGNKQAYGMLVKKYEKTMFTLAFEITGNKDISFDIIQNVFIKVYRNLSKFDCSKKFYSWIYRITLNESINEKKKIKRFDEYEDNLKSSQNLSEKAEKSEAEFFLRKAINKLDNKYKSLIVLKHFHNLSYEEISEIVEIPVKTVKSRLYTARVLLKELLQKVI